MPEFTTAVEFEVFCGSCGTGLCALSKGESYSNYTGERHKVTVDPCPNCMRTSRDEGYDEGLDDGRAEE